MTDGPAELVVELQPGSDVDTEELAEFTSRLRAELLELDVGVTALAPADEVPAGAKGPELLAVGGMLVHFVLQSDVLASIVRGVQSWLHRQRACSVKLTLDGDALEVTGVSSTEQDRLIALWVARHASPA
jgi:hypothetical protein